MEKRQQEVFTLGVSQTTDSDDKNTPVKVERTRTCWHVMLGFWLIIGQSCPRQPSGPSWPNGPITQLSPYSTQKPGTAGSGLNILHVPYYDDMWTYLNNVYHKIRITRIIPNKKVLFSCFPDIVSLPEIGQLTFSQSLKYSGYIQRSAKVLKRGLVKCVSAAQSSTAG